MVKAGIKSRSYTDEEKHLVECLKNKLKEAGVTKFPRDWHLKQLSTAKWMLSGVDSPSVADWLVCIDWAFSDDYWKDKIDHLARIMSLWPKFKLQQGGDSHAKRGRGRRTAIKKTDYANDNYANRGNLPF
ncbi:hypothetical protein [Desulfofarcimen acetoxidans]|uniref:hypothetical protein n=1 Tax=Desulfofarcimen acetoxidans TaxID=58138 RepID=UPI00019E4F19|nr:hypothetical protein [Desulfofarcimen acetoxidans]